MIPKIGADYQIDRQLASGGFGTVYLAKQVSLDRTVCVKRVHPHMMDLENHDVVAMFLDEARMVSRLRHENACRVIDCMRDAEGVPVIVMEYVEGCDAGTLIKRHGPLPWTIAAYVISEVLALLAEAHEPDPSTGRPGLIHRDIKPSNIALGNNGGVIVLDFGISKAVSDASGIAYTDSYKGSLPYSSREQLIPGSPLDRRVDLWQLGVTSWELLAGHGKRPFEQGERGTRDFHSWVARNILEGKRPHAREAFAHLPPEAEPLLDAIERMLQPLEERARDAYELIEHLSRAGLGLVTERRALAKSVQTVRPKGPRTEPERSSPFHDVAAPPVVPAAIPEVFRTVGSDSLPGAEQGAAATAPLGDRIGGSSGAQGPVKTLRLPDPSADGWTAARPGTSGPDSRTGDASRSKIILITAVLAVLAAGLGAFAVALFWGDETVDEGRSIGPAERGTPPAEHASAPRGSAAPSATETHAPTPSVDPTPAAPPLPAAPSSAEAAPPDVLEHAGRTSDDRPEAPERARPVHAEQPITRPRAPAPLAPTSSPPRGRTRGEGFGQLW